MSAGATESFVTWAKSETKWQLSPEPIWTVISDATTREILGDKVEALLMEAGLKAEQISLQRKEPASDADAILDVLGSAGAPDSRVYCACGAGTITDIARFVAHRSGRPFVSLPTAPSVDAYTSVGAPMIFHGVKQTVPASVPTALFADPDVLAAAPPEMLAAGFGDILGKYTALADWKLGELIWGEPRNREIADRMERTLERCVAVVAEIGAADVGSVEVLFRGLCDSGSAIAENGASHPASGSEHHVSHALEMLLLDQNRPPVLHGAKVGAAAVAIAELYQRVSALSVSEAESLMKKHPAVTADRIAQRIHDAYGGQSSILEKGYGPFAERLEAEFDKTRRRLIEKWETVQQIAGAVPGPETLTSYLRQAGAEPDIEALGFSAAERVWAIANGRFIRGRFTVLTLSSLLGFID